MPRPSHVLATEPAARRSLIARAAHSPALRTVAKVDVVLFRALRRTATPAVSAEVARFSALGEHAALWLTMGVTGAAADPARRARWQRATGSVLGAFAANVALKNVARRQRPVLEDLPALIATPTKLSFPSSHASTSFAAARAFSGPDGLLPAGPLYATATAMALSRIYLGVHYPSDILVGAALGTVVGSFGRTKA